MKNMLNHSNQISARIALTAFNKLDFTFLLLSLNVLLPTHFLVRLHYFCNCVQKNQFLPEEKEKEKESVT